MASIFQKIVDLSGEVALHLKMANEIKVSMGMEDTSMDEWTLGKVAQQIQDKTLNLTPKDFAKLASYWDEHGKWSFKKQLM